MFKSVLKMEAGLILRLVAVSLFWVIGMSAEAASNDAPLQSSCPAFPSHEFMTEHSHARMVVHVDAEYRGDWERLLKRLGGQLEVLKARHAEGKGVRLRLKDRTWELAGEKLARYIQASEKRLKVVACLAGRQKPSEFDAFETAASDETVSHFRPAGLSDRLQVSVNTRCKGGETLMKVKNTGPAWPQQAALDVLRINRSGVSLAVSRRLRMKENQMVTFRIPKVNAGSAGVGLFVRPSWYERPFKFDAEVACG